MTEIGTYREFFHELRRLGYVEGENLAIARYSGGGKAATYQELADTIARTTTTNIRGATRQCNARSDWSPSREYPELLTPFNPLMDTPRVGVTFAAREQSAQEPRVSAAVPSENTSPHQGGATI